MSLQEVEQQALAIARDNRETDPDIERVLWFPHDEEVRLIETSEQSPKAGDGDDVPAFYFGAQPKFGMPLPLAVALIRPDEVGRLRLPVGWGDWASAQEL